jgi:hypothetical protein
LDAFSLINEVAVMAGKLDEISRSIGSLEASVLELQRRMDEHRETQARRHADNSTALRELAVKLDQHVAAMEMIRPTVAALEMSRTKLATWASIGFAVAVLAGWVVEAAVKWAVARILSHLQ